MNQPLISVIIPVYNAEQYIERCIGSVQDNDYSNLEIICVNDGSTDRSMEVLQQFAAEDLRIRIIGKPNGGVSSARNVGLDVAKGEYVAFIDSDDWIHRQYFSILMTEALRTQADITIGKHLEICSENACDPNEQFCAPGAQTLSAQEAMDKAGYFRGYVWGRVYKRGIIADIRFIEGVKFGEDNIFNVLVGDTPGCTVAHFDLPLYYYYQMRSDSLVHSKKLEEGYRLGSWFIDHINLFTHKRIPIFASFAALLAYRYDATFSPDVRTVRVKTKEKLKQCMIVLLRDIDCSAVTKMKYIALSYSPALYRLALHITDPSVKHYEKLLRQRYAQPEK